MTEQGKVIVGFDLGHAESCLMWLPADGKADPKPLGVSEKSSFPTVFADSAKSVKLVGHAAARTPWPLMYEIGFKTRPTLPEWSENRPKLVEFIGRCLAAAQVTSGVDLATACYVVGCPSGWESQTDLLAYETMLREAGISNPRLSKESRAALILARDLGRLPPEQLNARILVVDIGSSTTDCSVLLNRQLVGEPPLGTTLGAGLLDKLILERNIKQVAPSGAVAEELRSDESSIGRALFACRELKERYFNADEERRQRRFTADLPLKSDDFALKLAPGDIDSILDQPIHDLGGLSWRASFRDLMEVMTRPPYGPPDHVILTGGAARMNFVQDACREVFGDRADRRVVALLGNPETVVAEGLARLGRWEYRCSRYDAEVQTLLSEESLLTIVERELPVLLKDFYLQVLPALFTDIVPACVDDYRAGKIDASEGLLAAVRAKALDWEQEGKKREAAATLSKLLATQLSASADIIGSRYDIPPHRLSFTIDFGTNTTWSESIRDLLSYRLVRWGDQGAGWLADRILKNAPALQGLLGWAAKAGSQGYGTLVAWLLKVTDGAGLEGEISKFAGDLAVKVIPCIRQDLQRQFEAKKDEVLVFVR